MPITKSAKKALRQSVRRRRQNLARKDAFRRLIKQAKGLAERSELTEAQKLLPQVSKALDKAVQRGVLKKRAAARKKSQIAKLLRPRASQ